MAKPATKPAKGKTADKPADKPAEKKKNNLPPRREYAYDISTLSEAIGRKPTGVRVLLRRLEIEKNDGRYGWDNKADYEAVLKQVRAGMQTERAPTEKADKAPAKKPAKKAA